MEINKTIFGDVKILDLKKKLNFDNDIHICSYISLNGTFVQKNPDTPTPQLRNNRFCNACIIYIQSIMA